MSRGAAVLVGAGMSANALSLGSSDRPPDWSELSRKLVRQLCGDNESRQKRLLEETGAVSGFLRLAEKFEARYGRSTLNDFLIDAVGDRRLAPGPMHEALVRLPWTDIFTTNWDTLLERAAELQSGRRYEPVFSPGDLPIRSRPRIVKLHGTMPHNTPFIFTEEDFRTYPDQFGPFVNTVQQAMMETVFVMIGFSGDDPNFLKWSGWVRDRLHSASPKIYMVSDFTESEDNLDAMRALNIVPVDLGQIPEEWFDAVKEDYQEGFPQRLGAWLAQLATPKRILPRSWPDAISFPPEVFDGSLASPIQQIKKFTETMRRAREDYPKWIIAPADSREKLNDDRPMAVDALYSADRRLGVAQHSESADPDREAVDWFTIALRNIYLVGRRNECVGDKASLREDTVDAAINSVDSYFKHDPDAMLVVATAYSEFLWNCRIGLNEWPLMAADILFKLVRKSCAKAKNRTKRWPGSSRLVLSSSDDQRGRATELTLELAGLLVTVLRETSGDSTRFARVSSWLAAHYKAACDYTRYNRVLYERALFAMDRGDIVSLRKTVLDDWSTRSEDMLCLFRRANLFGFLDTSANLDELRKDRIDHLERAFRKCRTNLSFEEKKSYKILSRESWLLSNFSRLRGQFDLEQEHYPDGFREARSKRQARLPEFVIEPLDDRLDELAAVRCDPRRELRRIERTIQDTETMRQGALMLDRVGWQVFEAELAPSDAPPSKPGLRYPVRTFGLRYIKATLETTSELITADKKTSSAVQLIDRRVSEALAMAFRCRLGPTEKVAGDFGWDELKNRLPRIGGHLALLNQRAENRLMVSRTLVLCLDALDASVSMMSDADQNRLVDAPRRFYHVVAILGALIEDIPIGRPAELSPKNNMDWPESFTLRAVNSVCSAMEASIHHADRLGNWRGAIGHALERLCSLVQRQVLTQVHRNKADMIEHMLRVFWNLPYTDEADFADPLSLIQNLRHDEFLAAETQLNCTCCRDAIASRETFSDAKKLRLLQLYDAVRDLGFSLPVSTRKKMIQFIEERHADDRDGMEPWQWMLIPDQRAKRGSKDDKLRQTIDAEFRAFIFERGIATADSEKGLLSDDQDNREMSATKRVLTNLAWAMRHRRIAFRPSAEDAARVISWLSTLATKSQASLTDDMKEDMTAIFLRRLAVEDVVREIEDPQICIKALVAFRAAGIKIEPAIPAFARLFSGHEAKVSPDSLGALLRAGLSSSDENRFSAAFDAAFTWIEDANNAANGATDAPLTLPMPPSLLGAFAQVLSSESGARAQKVRLVLATYVETHPDAPFDLLVQLWANLQERVDKSIEDAVQDKIVVPTLGDIRTALAGRGKADKDQIAQEIAHIVERQIARMLEMQDGPKSD